MDESLLPVETVRSLILAGVAPLPPVRIALDRAAARILAEPLVAGTDLPLFSNSAMDGYAVRSVDTVPAPVRLRVIGRIPAGRTADVAVGPGEAMAIATGAPIPGGSDAVIPVEQTVDDGRCVETRIPARPGLNVRLKGEDVTAGDVLLRPGTLLGPGQLAAAAATGASSLAVYPRPSVAVVPTGDEVVAPGGLLPPGGVHDALSVPLAALLAETGATPAPHPVVPDRPESVEEAVRSAAEAHDIVLTVGGVSVGPRDFVARNPRLPEVRSVGLALRPARPFAFGRIGRAIVLCLPGNPVSAFVAYEELVRPVVLALCGRPPEPRAFLTAALTEAVEGTPGKLRLVGCRVWREGRRLLARTAGLGGAVRMLAEANAWAVVPPDCAGLPAGASIEVRMLSEVAAER